MNQNEPVCYITLRDVIESDLPVFFEHERDPQAVNMAAFTAKDPEDRDAFNSHWSKIMKDDSVIIKTILFDKRIAGHIASFIGYGDLEITYWIGREFWGKGIATEACAMFMSIISKRPVYARVAKDNIASVCVLEKCGFKIDGEDKGFANARGEEIEEYIMRLA